MIVKHAGRAREGLSLAEVLIAIFVVGIGLLAVLTLFPLGAMSMARAIKDDRTASHHFNMAAMCRWIWKDELGLPGTMRDMYPEIPPAPVAGAPVRLDPLLNAMENPNYPHNPDLGPGGAIPFPNPAYGVPPVLGASRPRTGPLSHRPSYPVLVDPIGWNNSFVNLAGAQRYWVAGRNDCIPRRSLRVVEWQRSSAPATNGLFIVDPDSIFPGAKLLMRNRYLTLMEDIGFFRDGTPADMTGTASAGTLGTAGSAANLALMRDQVQRDGRYTCAFLLKRPMNNVRSILELTVIVFSGRPAEGPIREDAYTLRLTKGSTQAELFYTGLDRPRIYKGTWILDGTMTRLEGGVPVPDDQPHGIFYRVVNVEEDTEGGNPILRLELQEPAESNTFYPDANRTPYGIGVVMEGVAEVFPGKLLTPNSRPVP